MGVLAADVDLRWVLGLLSAVSLLSVVFDLFVVCLGLFL